MRLTDISGAQALRSSLNLEPIDGPGGRVFPPTCAPNDNVSERHRSKHVVEELPDGSLRVLIDSVASQANRQEAALVEARRSGLINFSDVYIDLSATEAGFDRLSATEMPHRLSDAILRDSEVDGVLFGKSEFGKRLLSATLHDLSPLLEASPTTVLYGCWFSQHNLPRPLKIQRSVVSEIWAENAVMGKAIGSRIDPLGIERVPLYEAADGEWTAHEAEALKTPANKLKRYSPKKGKKGLPSEINHGNIPPTLRDQGITAEKITLSWAMPMAAIRRLRFGGGATDKAGQAYITALGILARVLDHHSGYSLRSRCDLISAGALRFDLIDADGVVTSHETGKDVALQLLKDAEVGMKAAGLKIGQELVVKPGARLAGLIEANARLQAAGNGDEEDGE